jgi:leader peptidase (prepilin peptidase)/N-methyltransferase
MNILILVYLLTGLAIGSFVNVVIYRLKNAESFLIGYSKCPNCQKRIGWFDLVPILSFMILGGKCRNCNKKISWQYPIVEAVTALLFVLSYYLYGPTWESVLSSLTLALFLILVVYDFREMAVPDIFSWLLVIVVFFGQLALRFDQITSVVLGGLVTGCFIGALVYLSKKTWMGEGDILIALALGIYLGFPIAIFGIFSSFIIGAVFGSVLLATKIKKRQDHLPFTPFLLLGLVTAMIWGQQIVDWYLGRFII